MWFMWVQVVTWYPIVLGFGASTLAYLINPELAKSGVFTTAVIIVLYWLSTFVALNGMPQVQIDLLVHAAGHGIACGAPGSAGRGLAGTGA